MRSPAGEGAPCCSRLCTSWSAAFLESEVADRIRTTSSSWCPAPGEGAPAAGEAPSTHPTRPSPAGGREPGDDEDQLVLVHRAAGDLAALASGTRPEEVDVSEDGSARPAADRARSPGPHRPPRPGEPTLGVPADPRGAAEARHQDLRDDGPDDPAASWPGPGSPPARPNVDPSS